MALAISGMVLRVHQDKTFAGAMVASLSVPWGNTRDDIGGYHLVWPRDLVESAGGLLAMGNGSEASDILRYLIAEAGPVEVAWLYAESGGNLADLHALADRDLIQFGESETWRDPLQQLARGAAASA